MEHIQIARSTRNDNPGHSHSFSTTVHFISHVSACFFARIPGDPDTDSETKGQNDRTYNKGSRKSKLVRQQEIRQPDDDDDDEEEEEEDIHTLFNVNGEGNNKLVEMQTQNDVSLTFSQICDRLVGVVKADGANRRHVST